ncbi:MAG: diguanylate cyclase [Thiolinea sp.]
MNLFCTIQQAKSFVENFAKNIIEIIKNTSFKLKSEEIKNISISLGIAHYPTDSEKLAELYSYADAAMYENKKTRIGSYHFYQVKKH